MPKFPGHAKELQDLLEEDQRLWQTFWQENYKEQGTDEFVKGFEKVRQKQHKHTESMLRILDKIQEPSLSNIGKEAAQAVSIIALHDSLPTLKRVLTSFEQCYKLDKANTFYEAIPSLTDRVLILERKPQRFGTQWQGNGLSEPILPIVEDFDHVNERRLEYGLEPLHWPKSLAIPESEQPWLQRPIAELTMRDLTDEEFEQTYSGYLN